MQILSKCIKLFSGCALNNVRVRSSYWCGSIVDGSELHRVGCGLDVVRVFTLGLASLNIIHLDTRMWAHCVYIIVRYVPPNDLYNFVEGSESVEGLTAVINDGDNYGGDHVSALKDWFSRPIMLRRIAWAEGNSISTVMYPWADYFSNSIIRDKIRGYQKFKGNLHLKFMINATPFQYSKVLVTYKPLVKYVSTGYSTAKTPNMEVQDFGGGLIDYSASAPDPFIPLSQRQHLELYPCQCLGGEMTLPFVWPYNWLDLSVKKSDGSDTLFETFSTLGRLSIDSFFPLRTSTTAATQPINITIFAWMTDIMLEGPTLQQSGPLSGPATAVADAAESLSTIPVLAPYMAPVQNIGRVTAKLAKLFGWSNPPELSAARPVVPAPFVGLANPDLKVLGEKLTVDEKNGLSVDPRSVGLPESKDELAFQYLLSKKSFLTQFDWLMTDNPDGVLFDVRVNPCLAAITTRTTTSSEITQVDPFKSFPSYHMIPACLIAQQFKYWKGDITYHFEVVASQLHRGRLRLTYEPAGSAVVDNTGRLISRVFDLAESSKFSFTVPWQATSEWLTNTPVNGATSASQLFSSRGAAYVAYNPLSHNGTLRLSIMNELAASSPSADVRVLVYVDCSKVAFAEPVDIRRSLTGTQTAMNPAFVQQMAVFNIPAGSIVPTVYTNTSFSASLPLNGTTYSAVGSSDSAFDATYPAHLAFNKDGINAYWSTGANTFPASAQYYSNRAVRSITWKDSTGVQWFSDVSMELISLYVPTLTPVFPTQFSLGLYAPSAATSPTTDQFVILGRVGNTGTWKVLTQSKSAALEGVLWSPYSNPNNNQLTYVGYSSASQVSYWQGAIAPGVWSAGFNTFAVGLIRAISPSTNLVLNSLYFTVTDSDPTSGVWKMRTDSTKALFIQQSGNLLDAPQDLEVKETFSSESDGRGSQLVYMGESVESLRQLMHRSFLHSFVPLIPTTAMNNQKSKLFVFATKIPRVLRPYGIDQFGSTWNTWTQGATTLKARVNVARPSPLLDILPCFLAYKGSMVYKIVDLTARIPVTWDSNTAGSTVLNQGLDHLVVTHSHDTRPFGDITGTDDQMNPVKYDILDGSIAQEVVATEYVYYPSVYTGVAHSMVDTQKGVTVVIPDYNKAKYHSANLTMQAKRRDVVNAWEQRICPWLYDEAYDTIDIYGKGAMAQNTVTTGASVGPNATAVLGNQFHLALYYHPGDRKSVV